MRTPKSYLRKQAVESMMAYVEEPQPMNTHLPSLFVGPNTLYWNARMGKGRASSTDPRTRTLRSKASRYYDSAGILYAKGTTKVLND